MTYDREKIEQYFIENKNYDSATKKFAFVLGVLVDALTRIQFAVLRSTPFRDGLYSLALNEKRIKKIYTNTFGKLMEYGRRYPQMQELCIELLDLAEQENFASKTIISDYFTRGLTLGKRFYTKKEGDKKDE